MSQCLHPPAGSPPRYEVAEVLRLYSADPSNDRRIPAPHRKVIAHLVGCRTAALGGHLYRCDHCGRETPRYNSCRDRHCPKCQTMAKEEWIENRRRDLPPVSYFHTVFTLPHDVNPLVLTNKRVILGLFFRNVAATLMAFGADPRWKMGGQLGFLSILHTWTQTLLDHFHLHCLIPAGVVSPDRARWIPCPYDTFLFPVQALSMVFRGKFLDSLQQAYRRDLLIFPGRTARWKSPEAFNGLVAQLRSKEWVVYTKPPLESPDSVLEYLARYTHRVAISNHRILSVKDGSVTFTYKDRSQENSPVKRMTLTIEEFSRRFLLHILPGGFQKIRCYGFLANRTKAQSVPVIRAAIGQPPVPAAPPAESVRDRMLRLTGRDITLCPHCRTGTLRTVGLLVPAGVSGNAGASGKLQPEADAALIRQRGPP